MVKGVCGAKKQHQAQIGFLTAEWKWDLKKYYKYKSTNSLPPITHRLTHKQTQYVSVHANSLSGFFHQLDLSQLIISSFEPWAQSMIALSINAYMIYFDGASNDKGHACVCVCVCLCLFVHSHTHKYSFYSSVNLSFSILPVHMCISRQGVVNQFRLNWKEKKKWLCIESLLKVLLLSLASFTGSGICLQSGCGSFFFLIISPRRHLWWA